MVAELKNQSDTNKTSLSKALALENFRFFVGQTPRLSQNGWIGHIKYESGDEFFPELVRLSLREEDNLLMVECGSHKICEFAEQSVVKHFFNRDDYQIYTDRIEIDGPLTILFLCPNEQVPGFA